MMTAPASLDDLHVRACGLAYEGWRGRPGASLFCAKEARAGNLACAHTMARYRLRAALEARATRGADGAEADLAEWQALDVAIGAADHARSDAEKHDDQAGVAAAIAAHDALAERLAALLARARRSP